MTHSSGGGSHGGGSHGGSSSHGGSGSSGRSNTYIPGYTRYLYYKNNRPHYFYSKTRISPGGVAKAKFRAIIMAIALIAFYSVFFVPILKSVVHNPKKLDMDYQEQTICVVDNLHILDDVEIDNLYNEMEEFQDITGITPIIYISSNEEWKGHYVDLEAYAYDIYVNQFADEKHWLLVYTQPEDYRDGFNDWYWEGMQGDYTDPILTTKATDQFNSRLHKRLLDNDYTVGEAFVDAFKDINGSIMDKYIDWKFVGIFAGILIHASIFFACFVILPVSLAKKDSKAIEMPDPTATYQEDKCLYCGGLFVHGIHTSCPHCGGAIPPSDQQVSVNTVDPGSDFYIPDDYYGPKV